MLPGTGQHVVHFGQHLPQVDWQPSDCDEKSTCSILGYIKASGLSNIKEPLSINTTEPIKQWADGALVEASYDLILCINMMHISEWPATEGLFQGSGYYLKPGGTLATYGPYKMHGNITPESNLQFDMMLKQQNSDWGLRDVDDLEKLAKERTACFSRKL
ncbi:Methyltransferase-like 26 [Lamellibrachia satsuma]|nr:Methyltransferase-like 26 [Lamellibrachia satsuma]